MVEEKVIQQESVASVEQSVAATDAPQTPPAVDVEAIKAEYEAKLTQERASREKAEKSFGELKTKVDDMYKKADEKRVKTLEDQGQFKPLWEEANKTNQEKVREIDALKAQLDELRRSNETEAVRNSADIPEDVATDTIPPSRLAILSSKALTVGFEIRV